MTEDVDADLAELKKQTSHGDRLDEAGRGAERRELQGDILAELEAIDTGDRQKTVSVWDGDVAALITALDKDGNEAHLDAVGAALREALGRDTDADVDRSEVLRLALRLGLREAAPEYLDALREAVGKRAADQI